MGCLAMFNARIVSLLSCALVPLTIGGLPEGEHRTLLRIAMVRGGFITNSILDAAERVGLLKEDLLV